MSDNYNKRPKHNLPYQMQIKDEQEMMDFSVSLVKWLTLGNVIYLKGDLGAGKTTLVRGMLRALGHQGAVKSPTFTLVESYSLDNNMFYDYNSLEVNVKPNSNDKRLSNKRRTEVINNKIIIYHFDLYRLEDPEELEYMGIRDYLDGSSIVLIEWPEKGQGILPKADLTINITYQNSGQLGRIIDLFSQSDAGTKMIFNLIESSKQ
ncbi:MAG: tRNA (adenosine(37)-N6)-threonylcarbamoyltransferase complex ATPase subunit type 1 TsaE [Gammaproteobacteria bacterium]|nr:tRNA (adenosine(37)-N6)-threonylcarbamoyltransferase complex ATPase subunit type 1 TsaE [Gammaproteobacteria bacterium]